MSLPPSYVLVPSTVSKLKTNNVGDTIHLLFAVIFLLCEQVLSGQHTRFSCMSYHLQQRPHNSGHSLFIWTHFVYEILRLECITEPISYLGASLCSQGGPHSSRRLAFPPSFHRGRSLCDSHRRMLHSAMDWLWLLQVCSEATKLSYSIGRNKCFSGAKMPKLSLRKEERSNMLEKQAEFVWQSVRWKSLNCLDLLGTRCPCLRKLKFGGWLREVLVNRNLS